MNIYNAILMAADYIEANPREFSWRSVEVPTAKHCGTPGCAVGWIGTFLGVKRFMDVASALGIPDELDFYGRMGSLSRSLHGDYQAWKSDVRVCANTMRAYAAEFHIPERPTLRSDSELVADLLRKISTERIPEDAPA